MRSEIDRIPSHSESPIVRAGRSNPLGQRPPQPQNRHPARSAAEWKDLWSPTARPNSAIQARGRRADSVAYLGRTEVRSGRPNPGRSNSDSWGFQPTFSPSPPRGPLLLGQTCRLAAIVSPPSGRQPPKCRPPVRCTIFRAPKTTKNGSKTRSGASKSRISRRFRICGLYASNLIN